ncbi:MAG: TolC family outer membrane protein [Betaproteobacteria bacterium]|nr:TolC family outer membrane protein [Betaproteobacteria bacterium]
MVKLAVRGTVAAVALAFSGVAAAETLKEIVTFAIETHPQVLGAARKKDAADSAIDAAKGGYYPRIDYQYGAGREHSKNQTTRLTTPNWVDLNRRQESMVLNQMLFDGLGVAGEVDRRKAISDSSAHRVYSSAEDTALQTVQAYLSVLKNTELVQFAKDNLAAHQRTFDQVKLRAEKGVGRRADLEQIDARLALAVSNLSAAESALRDGEIEYFQVVNKTPVNLTKPEAPAVPASVDEAIKAGLQNHPVLRSALSDIDAAQAQREIAKSFHFPRLELEASYSDNKNLDGVVGPNRDRLVMLWVKWNIFRGGFDYYSGEETAKQITEAQEIVRNTNRQVDAAVRKAYNAYATARDRLPPLERYVKSSDATRVAYAQQFAIGQRTLLDLLDSENEYFTSRSTYVNAQFIELENRFKMLNAMGALLTAMQIKPPEEAIARTPSTPPPAEKQSATTQPEQSQQPQAVASPAEQQPAEAKQPDQTQQPQAETQPSEQQQPAEAKQPEQAQPQAEASPPEQQQPVEATQPEQPRAETNQVEQQPVEVVVAERKQVEDAQ